jgi:ACS family hexuronate transporter-like MFS transporter
MLFDYAHTTQLELWGFKGIDTGYMIIFSICAVAYLIGWIVMKALVPHYKPVQR